jgi:hypothetical protein
MSVEVFDFERETWQPEAPYDQGPRPVFTVMLLLNGATAPEDLAGPGWSGLVVGADGDVVFTTGLVWSRDRAVAGVREFLRA